MKISTKYFPIIGLLLFIFVISRIDIKKTMGIILGSNIIYIVLSLIILAITVFIRSLKWRVIVNFFNNGYTTSQAFKTYLIGVAFGSVTPGKAGDFVKMRGVRLGGQPVLMGSAYPVLDSEVLYNGLEASFRVDPRTP